MLEIGSHVLKATPLLSTTHCAVVPVHNGRAGIGHFMSYLLSPGQNSMVQHVYERQKLSLKIVVQCVAVCDEAEVNLPLHMILTAALLTLRMDKSFGIVSIVGHLSQTSPPPLNKFLLSTPRTGTMTVRLDLHAARAPTSTQKALENASCAALLSGLQEQLHAQPQAYPQPWPPSHPLLPPQDYQTGLWSNAWTTGGRLPTAGSSTVQCARAMERGGAPHQ